MGARLEIYVATTSNEEVSQCSSTMVCNSAESGGEGQKNLVKVWWPKGKPTVEDEKATKLFLSLRDKLSGKFDDKKAVKTALWNEIAKGMKMGGYDICCNSKEGPGGKCKQKFINLQSGYLKHIKHMKTTGEVGKDPPPYFAELHSILGGKHKVNPKYLEDSEKLQNNKTCDNNTDEELSFQIEDASDFENRPRSPEATTSADTTKHRFSSVKKSVRPQNSSELLLEEIKRQHEIDRRDQEQRFTTLQEMLDVQNQQRGQMLGLMKELIKSNKRKRESSDSE